MLEKELAHQTKLVLKYNMKCISVILFLTNLVFIKTQDDSLILLNDSNPNPNIIPNYVSQRFHPDADKQMYLSRLENPSLAELTAPETSKNLKRSYAHRTYFDDCGSRTLCLQNTPIKSKLEMSKERLTVGYEIPSRRSKARDLTTHNEAESITPKIEETSDRTAETWNCSTLNTLMIRITEMKKLLSRQESTVMQICKTALLLKETNDDALHHECASLIIIGNVKEALKMYKVIEKKESIETIVQIAVKKQSSALYDILTFIFKTHSEFISLALNSTYSELISLKQMNIINTLIFYKMTSPHNLNLELNDILEKRLTMLCRNNEFIELYEYVDNNKNMNTVYQLIPLLVRTIYDHQIENLPNILTMYSKFKHEQLRLRIIFEILSQIKENKHVDMMSSSAIVIVHHILQLQSIIIKGKDENYDRLLKRIIDDVPKSISPLLRPINCIKNVKTKEYLFAGVQRNSRNKKAHKLYLTSEIYPSKMKKLLGWSLFNILFTDDGDSVYIKNDYFNETIYVNKKKSVIISKLNTFDEYAKWNLELVDGKYFYFNNTKFNTLLHSSGKLDGNYRKIGMVKTAEKADKWEIGFCKSKSTTIV